MVSTMSNTIVAEGLRKRYGDVDAVDGVSLTVAELLEDAFAVALVPHTLEATTLRDLAPGQPVNLEADVLAKYVERLVAPGLR